MNITLAPAVVTEHRKINRFEDERSLVVGNYYCPSKREARRGLTGGRGAILHICQERDQLSKSNIRAEPVP